MFQRKYSVTLINSKWDVIKTNLKFNIIPRIDEYVFMDGEYHTVMNVVHQLNHTHEIFIIIDKAIKNLKG